MQRLSWAWLGERLNEKAEGQPSAARYPLTIACAAGTAALAPAFMFRWHIGFYPTTLLEAAILVTLAIFAIESWRARAIPSWRGPLLLPTLLFLMAGAISVLDAPSRLAALGIYRAYLVEPIFFALALVTVIRAPRHAHAIIIGFCAGASVLAVLNVATALIAFMTQPFNPAASPAVAVYTAANAVALYLIPLIAVTGAIVVHGTERRLRIGLAAFVVLALITTLLTFSRGGWVALGAVAVGLALTHKRRWLLLGGLAGAGIALALIPTIQQRIAQLFQVSGTGELGGRIVLWKETLKMLEGRPLLGAGMAGFAQRMDLSKLPYQIPQIYPHNIVLDFWSETGLLGLFAFAAIMVVAMSISWRGWRGGAAGWRPIHLGVLLALVAIVVHGLVDNPYFKNDLALEFWALVALSVAGATRPAPAIATAHIQARARIR